MDVLTDTIKQMIAGASPHMRALGYEIVELSGGHGLARLPYSEKLIGDPSTGVLHGGVITTLLDSTAGAVVISKVMKPMPIATLDLRIDYLRPATPRQDVRARVECFKATRNVAFVRGTAFNDDESDPVASMAGTFMLKTMAVREGAKGQ